MHVEIGEIHLGNEIVAAKELLNGAMPLHLEVLVRDVLVGLTEIHTPSTFLRDREEVWSRAVGGLRW